MSIVCRPVERRSPRVFRRAGGSRERVSVQTPVEDVVLPLEVCVFRERCAPLPLLPLDLLDCRRRERERVEPRKDEAADEAISKNEINAFVL